MRKNKKYLVLPLAMLLLFGLSMIPTMAAEGDTDSRTVQIKSKSLTLPVGVSRTLEFNFDIGRINLTDGKLFTYQRISVGGKFRKLLLVPKDAGYTDMTMHDTSGRPRITYFIRVTREDIGQILSQLEQLIGDVEGLKIKSVGGTVILDGEIILPKDMVRIIRVVDALKDRDAKKKTVPIKNIASISKITMKIIAERIEREIASPEISVRVLNNNMLLEGTAPDNYQADRAVEIARTYLPEVFVEKTKGEGGEVKPKKTGGNAGGLPVIIDLLRIAQRPAPAPSNDVKITMNYVELLNEYEKSFNFSWRPLAQERGTVEFDTSIGEITANLVATVTSLFPKLITAKEHAHARILKTESIIIKDGSKQEGVIESSLDFYVRQINERGEANLQPIKVQNFTKVKAKSIPGSDSLELGIQISLNSLVGTNQGAPIIAKNSLQTQVTIKNGDSAALGGYAIDQSLSGYNREPSARVPGIGDTEGGSTALFNLNRSKSYQRNKRQYVIFVTPEIIRTASAGTEDITRKFRLNAGEY